MTCIVGLVDSGKVFIGADSAGLSGWHLTLRADAKVFEAHGFLYGFAGSFRLGQILRYQFKPPPIQGDLMTYMVSAFVPELRKTVGAEVSTKAQTESPGSFLVGVGGRLFEVDADYQVGENLDGVAACGCGREPALGALYVLRKSRVTSPAITLRTALQAAEHYSGGVRGPFKVLGG